MCPLTIEGKSAPDLVDRSGVSAEVMTDVVGSDPGDVIRNEYTCVV